MCSNNNKDYIKKTCSYMITINPPTQCLCTNFAITVTQNEQIGAGQASTGPGCPREAVKSVLGSFNDPIGQSPDWPGLNSALTLLWVGNGTTALLGSPPASVMLWCSLCEPQLLEAVPCLHSLPPDMLVTGTNPVLPQPMHIPWCQVYLSRNCV